MENLEQRIAEAAAADPLGCWYQPVTFGNIVAPAKDDRHLESFGFGKWRNYIKPLLKLCEPINGVFCEFGCNAGLNLLLAEMYGFSRMWGIECAPAAWIQLKITKEYYSTFDIRSIFETVGKPEENISNTTACQFEIVDIPCVDVVLMANFHHYVEPEVLEKLLYDLSYISKYLIVVSAEDAKGGGIASCPVPPNEWEIGGCITTCDGNIENGWRNQWSTLFASKHCYTLETKDLYRTMIQTSPANNKFYTQVWPRFVKDPDNNIDLVVDWLIKGKCDSEKFEKDLAIATVAEWWDMVNDLRENGQREPIQLLDTSRGEDLWDGHHRIGTLNELGIKRTYAWKP